MKKNLLLYPFLLTFLFACESNDPEKDTDGQKTTKTNIMQLTKDGINVSTVRISEDGSKVYFAANSKSGAEPAITSNISVINYDASNERKLITAKGTVSNLVVGTKQSMMAFASNYKNNNANESEMIVTDINGKVKFRLEHTKLYKQTPYMILSSGKILFNRHGNYSGECSCNTIWKIDPDGKNEVRLNEKTDLMPTHDATLKDLTPDERVILFTNVLGGTYTMQIDGNNLRQLGATMTPVAISPDGKTILAHRNVMVNDKSTIQVFTMNLDGSNIKQVTSFESINSPIEFSPDGRKILFSSNKDHSTDQSSELYLMDLDGSNVERLTDNDVTEEAYGFLNDGKSILFSTKKAGIKTLYVMKDYSN
ncbi:PD40 domain-containing protein [Pontibacter arcticus]|uniref:Prolow-density lipoprotein receptor-related protein 1-like beta-propeller domain-containing protein n=1 Tax=Pontibacter arcticus TaxID=2080288 RepID=A0A364RFQ7_9BACT|nr:PD40 domain-containing protein [Pontibacter arcticus]RAU83097.1 hypothetical protein DP923_07660 [Pontibacter arcticus]